MQEFDTLTDEDAWESVDYLQRQVKLLAKTKFLELERNVGFVHNPNGLLQDQTLRQFIPPSSATFDLLHCFWNAGGIAPVEVGLFVEKLRSDGMTWEQLQSSVPHNISSTVRSSVARLKRLLSEPYFGGNIGWKASGSEHMSMLPLLHLWLMLHIHGTERWCRLEQQCKSFQLLCERLYALCALVWSQKSHFCDLLEAKQHAHFKEFLVAYGRDHCRPKHHYTLHVCEAWRKFRYCLDTKTQERKHQVLKKEIESSGQNLTGFEERMLRQLYVVQTSELQKHSESIGQVVLYDCTKVKANHWQSSTLKQNLVTWKKDQVVIQHDLLWAGKIHCFAKHHNTVTCLIEIWHSDGVIGFGHLASTNGEKEHRVYDPLAGLTSTFIDPLIGSSQKTPCLQFGDLHIFGIEITHLWEKKRSGYD